MERARNALRSIALLTNDGLVREALLCALEENPGRALQNLQASSWWKAHEGGPELLHIALSVCTPLLDDNHVERFRLRAIATSTADAWTREVMFELLRENFEQTTFALQPCDSQEES
ncbi:hypothetical protein M2401_005520 [Pseudomonas sp. JUb42]|uniref:hypothetical protein n=1 Tax=Pseudomonas sp. JUb42 TaxID=2940611 RepID=UPI002169E80F|nr:hypothetical protein [Pseudomonas sp. JUb42]MCS3471756.1 hypothetical protein [Pseudomonas sp. JUb42]